MLVIDHRELISLPILGLGGDKKPIVFLMDAYILLAFGSSLEGCLL